MLQKICFLGSKNDELKVNVRNIFHKVPLIALTERWFSNESIIKFASENLNYVDST